MSDKHRDSGRLTSRRDFIVSIPLGIGALAAGRRVLADPAGAVNKSTAATPFRIGIQTHAHDFLYEGTQTVIETACDKAGVNAVFTCATYVKENMRLPHNPKFTRYPTQGGFYFNFDPKLYAGCAIQPVRTPEENVNEFDAMRAVSQACKRQGVRFYPWVSSFNYPQEGPLHPDHQVVAADGRKHTGWLCPNSPEARKFSLAVYEDLVRNYEIDGVFVDRFRFPDDLTTCFCDHCARAMKDQGLDPKALRQAALSLTDKASQINYLALTTLGLSIDPMFYIAELPEVAALVRFKMDTISSYVQSVYERVKSINAQVEVGLDMFSPSVAWQVGQEPAAIGRHCDWIKPMVYHVGDGRQAIRMIERMAQGGLGDEQALYEQVKRMLNAKGMELPDAFEEFRKTGFPVSWVETEIELTRKLTAAQKPLYAGIQLWPPTPPSVVSDAIRAAVRAKSEGVFLYCYGWSTIENMEVAGRTLRQSGLV